MYRRTSNTRFLPSHVLSSCCVWYTKRDSQHRGLSHRLARDVLRHEDVGVVHHRSRNGGEIFARRYDVVDRLRLAEGCTQCRRRPDRRPYSSYQPHALSFTLKLVGWPTSYTSRLLREPQSRLGRSMQSGPRLKAYTSTICYIYGPDKLVLFYIHDDRSLS